MRIELLGESTKRFVQGSGDGRKQPSRPEFRIERKRRSRSPSLFSRGSARQAQRALTKILCYDRRKRLPRKPKKRRNLPSNLRLRPLTERLLAPHLFNILPRHGPALHAVVVPETVTAVLDFPNVEEESRARKEGDDAASACNAPTTSDEKRGEEGGGRRTQSEVVSESVGTFSFLLLDAGNATRVLHRSGPTTELLDEIEGHTEAGGTCEARGGIS
jgi:hypothetical protein